MEMREAIHRTAVEGAALVKGVIKGEFLKQLIKELEAGPFEKAAEDIATVKQNFDRYAFFEEAPGMPLLSQMQLFTQSLIRLSAADYPILAEWTAKDIVIQRYGQDGLLTAHKDLRRHPYLIASFTLTGSCRFELLDNRNGKITKTMIPEPGDLVLLRAPGLANDKSVDDRPFHQVSGSLDPRVPRLSLVFRDNHNPDTPINGFTYHNKK